MVPWRWQRQRVSGLQRQQQLCSQVKREVCSALGPAWCIVQGRAQETRNPLMVLSQSPGLLLRVSSGGMSPPACAQHLESDIMGHHKSQPQLIPHLPVAQEQSLVVPIPELILMEVIQPNGGGGEAIS